jgi:hypothetical protein
MTIACFNSLEQKKNDYLNNCDFSKINLLSVRNSTKDILIHISALCENIAGQGNEKTTTKIPIQLFVYHS